MELPNLKHLDKLAKNPGFVLILNEIISWRDSALQNLRNSGDSDAEQQLHLLHKWRERDDLVKLIDYTLQRAKTELEELKNGSGPEDSSSDRPDQW